MNTNTPLTRNPLARPIRAFLHTLKRVGERGCLLLPLLCGLLCAEGALAVQGNEFIAPPRYNLTDRFSVNHFSGDVSAGVDTVSIGGERGLSHAISARTNLFEYPGNRGFNDKFAAGLQYKVIGEHVAVRMGEPTQPLVWVMSASALGETADFLVLRNGAYAFDGRDFTTNYSYEAIGDKRHTLAVQGGSRVWTQPDGTQVFFGISSGGAGWGSSASKIVYPNGFTLNLHYDTGVTTNTGFQLKFDYLDDDPGLAPEKQGRTFPEYSVVPTETQSAQAQWWRKNPKHIVGINNAVEYCNPDSITPCSLTHAWPTATFHWPGGMPRAIYIDQTDVIVENAAGGKTRLTYEAVDAAQREDGTIIETETAGVKMAPRLVAYTAPGADAPTLQYTYKNQIGTRPTGNGSTPYLITRAGETQTAQGILGAAAYSHNPGQWGEIVHVGGQVSASVSSALPGTLQDVQVNNDLSIFSFEASYRNFPKVVTDYNGPNKRYTYDNRGNVTQVEHLPAINGQAVIYAAGYPATCANPKTCNQPQWITDPLGHRTDYTYHPDSGQVATVTGPADANGIRPVTRYTYAQKYAYYKKNGSTVEQADSPLWLLTQAATCRTTATVGSACAGGVLDEVVTEYDYGPQDGTPNNLLLRSTAVTAEVAGSLATRTTCFEYDIYGHRIGETAPNGTAGGCSTTTPQSPAAYKQATRYNIAGQVTGTIAPDPDGSGPRGFPATRNTYDDDGRLVRTERGELTVWQDDTVDPQDWTLTVLSSVQSQYDDHGRPIEERSLDANGATVKLVHTSYDARGNVLCKALRMNLAATTATDACTATTGPGGQDRITRYDYNAKDQVRIEWRAVDTAFEQKYAEYTFDNMLITGMTDANGNKTELRYDDHGRLNRRVYPSKTTPGLVNESDYEAYDYDLDGNRIWEHTRSGATLIYPHDALNRMTKKVIGTAQDVYYGYELSGVQTFARFGAATGQGITINYTGFGEPETETNNLGGVSRTISRTFDANSNRTRITHPDGISFSYQFDGLNRVTGVGEGSATNNLLTLPYHPNGGRDGLLRTGGAQTHYAYDAAQRIDQVTEDLAGTGNDLITGFDFNPAGQITRVTKSRDLYHYFGNANQTGEYQVNGLNQYVSVDGRSFSYDANGNLTSDGVNSYTYDAENRLTAVSGGVSATLSYDPLGRLYRYTVNGQTTDFLYDGDALIAEYQGGSLVRRYVHGDEVDEPWVQYTGAAIGASQRVYLHTDHQHSIIAHSDGLGNSVSTLRYDAYGIADSGNVGRFGYTGQIWLAEIGLYYYKARMYSPVLGRFMQTDPIGYEDQMNLYAYVGNDPMNATDPSGMSNCPNGDSDCVETPESESIVGPPEPTSDEVKEIEEIVVTGHRERKPKMRFNVRYEQFFVADTNGMKKMPDQQRDISCPGNVTVTVMTGKIAPGQAAVHTHPNTHKPFPSHGDGSAATKSTTGAAFLMTSKRVFMIEAMSNGTFRTTLSAGPGLSSSERAKLISNMQQWETPPPPPTNGVSSHCP